MRNSISNENSKAKKSEIINSFIVRTKIRLLKRQKVAYWSWVILSFIIMVINFVILTAAIYILSIILKHYRENPKDPDFISTIAGPVALLFAALLSFAFFLIIAIFQTKTKRLLYKTAFRDLQFESVNFTQKIDDYSGKDPEKQFKNKILTIKRNVKFSKSKKLTWKNILKSMLLKDSNA